MTVTASLPPDVGAVDYVWFVNGEMKGTGTTITVGSDLTAGFYRLDVTVTTTDGSRGGSAGHDFTIIEGEPLPPEVVQLESGISQTGTVTQDGWVYYSIDSTASDTEIESTLTNLSADIDLYVRADVIPTKTEYDIRSANGDTQDEICLLPNTGATTWYLGVYGYEAGSCTITATLSISQQVTLMWDPNTEPDLDGYKLYYGNTSGTYPNVIDVGNTETYTVNGLVPGETYYFAATAYTTAGLESGLSNELVYTVPL
jgi:hypothetical protein